MEKTSKILLEKDYQKGDLGSIGVGASVAGPFGALLGLGANRLYRWGRNKYLQNKAKKDTEKQTKNTKNNNKEPNNKATPEDLKQKIQKAQDEIRNAGILDPDVYKTYQFYKTTIYDTLNPEGNNFLYISKTRDGGKAYEEFLNYWTEKYTQKYLNKKTKIAPNDIENFKKLVKERFKKETNQPCLISVPQYFLINQKDVLSMAKNSDISEKEKVIYNDKPSFDSNFAFDLHMYKNKNEEIETDNIEDYKTSLILTMAYGRNYVYSFDLTGKDIYDETEKVLMALGNELIGEKNQEETDDKVANIKRLGAFTKVIKQLVEEEKQNTNIYTVAAPLLRKNTMAAKDLEYNATLLDGIGIYITEEEFKKNYLEDYQKLIENQMGI